MIYTFYSNCYEGLQEALFQNIEQDIADLRGNLKNVFRKIPVITPSPSIDNQLSHALADRASFTSNPGVEFISLFEWLQYFTETVLRPESQGSALVWQIWWALKNEKFMKKLKDASPEKSAYRLSDYVYKSDNCQLLDFCIRLSTLYTTYASYRVDWLLHWMDENKFQLVEPKKKADILENQPDYYWQKKLWEFIAANDQTGDFQQLKSIPDKLNDATLPDEIKGMDFHLFMPFALPPLALPFIKAYSESKDADLTLYIMNPSSEYWYDSLPKNLFDWDTQADDAALQYLRRNASSTRAVIDRLYGFLNLDNGNVYEAETEDQPPKLIASPNKRRFSSANVALQELQLSTTAETQCYYFENNSESYLHRFQDSILRLDSTSLPGQPRKKDESLKVFKAPTFIRELEGIVDWLHYRFTEDPNLKASDVLIVVPDIEKAAPEIEGVMGGLSEKLRLPWKIVDNSIIDTELTVQAIIDLGALLNSSFEKADFLDWLELPINRERWQLSLPDISTISNWLDAAGFHKGLSSTHLSYCGYQNKDFSLDNAIERLTLGYFVNQTERQPCANVLPIFGNESEGFDKVSDDRGRILKNLISISQALKSCWKDLFRLKDGASPQVWHETIGNWLNLFFNLPQTPQNLISFKLTLVRVIEAMKSGLPNDSQIPFDALWRLLESRLHSSKAYIKQIGAITFAPIAAVRGLPYKIIVAAGFDETSGFPGKSSFDEFDLMGVEELKRKGDRDSRDDKRVLFLDALLSARDSLVISYSVGTNEAQENNPSPVLESFKHYFLSQANRLDGSGKTAKEIWETIEVPIPLNSFSKDNFKKTTKSKSWLSPRQELLESVKQAIDSQYSKDEEIFIDKSLAANLPERLPAQVIVNFLNDPVNYITKKLGLPYEGGSTTDSTFTWLPDDSALQKSIRFRQVKNDYESSFVYDDLVKRRELDPSYGIKSVRSAVIAGELKPIDESWNLCQEKLEGSVKGSKNISLQLSPTVAKTTGVIAVIDSTDSFYCAADDSHRILATANSEAARKRAGIRHLIWHASGEQNLISVLFTGTKTDSIEMTLKHIDKNQTIELVELFVELLWMAEKHGLSLIGKEGTLLWRGIDCRPVMNKTTLFSAAIERFFTWDSQAGCYGANYDELRLRTQNLRDTLVQEMSRIHK